MRIGVFIFATEYTIDIAELARTLEDRGFDALFVPEHTHIPISRKSAWSGGDELPKKYSHTYDPFVSLSFAAAATQKLELGTGICLVPQRDPIVTAKCVASLDRLSGGRFIFGIGGGWNVEEMNDHGVQYDTRFKQMREHILAMKALWTEDVAEYHGEFVQFEKSWSYPKPVQTPHPPIILGGESKYTLRRVVEFCDGWFPRLRGFQDPKARMAEFRQIADEASRDFSTLSTTLFGAAPDSDCLNVCEEAGVDCVLFQLKSEGREVLLPRLDELAKFIGNN